MKIAIFGPRAVNESKENLVFVYRYIAQFVDWREVTHIVSGGAIGADTLGALLCKELQRKGYPIKLVEYLPDWYPGGTFDRGAGFRRNKDIERDSQMGFAFINPLGTRNGTNNTIGHFGSSKKPCYETDVPDQTINPKSLKKGYRKS